MNLAIQGEGKERGGRKERQEGKEGERDGEREGKRERMKENVCKTDSL